MQEQGLLTKMKTKWWQEKRGGGACSVSDLVDPNLWQLVHVWVCAGFGRGLRCRGPGD